MELDEQLDRFDALTAKLRGIIIKKGCDYANEDKLSNFKTAGPNAGLTPEQNCLSLISTKVARLGTLFNLHTNAQNESVTDSVEDLINYGILLHMILNENKNDDLPF